MSHFGKFLSLLSALAMLALFQGVPALAQEHPEHPAQKTAQAFSVDDMAAAITKYVAEDSKLKGGFFLVYDAKAGAALTLKLDKVHRERLSQVGAGVVFVCADFKAADGKIYDLDIFMKGPDKDHLAVTEIMVHKENGAARYTWFEDGGVWKRKPV